jgi:PilZ domain
MEISNGFKERRKYPRFELDLPLEYWVSNVPRGHGGLVINASESGLLIRSLKHMTIAQNIRIVVFFPWGYELDGFEALAEIVRMETHPSGSNVEYRYGLRFVEIREEDLWKLRQLLGDRPASQDTLWQNHRQEESVQGWQAQW